MSLADMSPTQVKKGPQCHVCRELARLKPADAKALKAHLGNPEWRFTDLADALFEESGGAINLRAHQLSRHARGDCAARERVR